MKKNRLMIRTVILLLLGTAVAYTLYANFTKGDIQKVAIGEKAPDFVLTDINGEKHRLSDYQGQGVFLNFYGTWCKPCEKEMPYINNQYNHFKDDGVQVLAVNVGESKLAVNKFVEKYNLDFPNVIDEDGQVQSAYGINPLPATFLIDAEGTVIKYHTGELTESMVKNFMEQIKP
ncbi:thiol-disulfide oxidoreductase [Bacillus canaveralius]|uniref:Thiol-disulfide oxidoreductase n=1 Tax=Bacillus canaveralius TaxID=1403243 RepID=A0A2N5GRQ5_9BACI|nr:MULTISPECIES: thiol-disulfide oxidoreductase ResA [Bacillus]PLR84579.1 thiol-disulfide oxidoreductase [Bacillus sp. V33-4]PLR86093.1 thiol-disulfide oxidoreductase [Bacillus canaveralius]PLS00213.1 thiol-disulfide oxidoreductase [Bacillus canaveralius]RSK52023.1 thiol-disulfide oxidoreductase ResA [Bacillus canaveralius]